MPAPDLPPPPTHTITERPLHVHLHPRLTTPNDFAGGVVIVIDALRASVTITAAIAHGATCVIPTLSVEDALAARDAMAATSHTPILLGGERGGVRIEGFDLDNSPLAYTPQRVRDRVVVFTTTNGTAALLHARHAASIFVGSFANLNAVTDAVAHDPRPVHILCAGTRDLISEDDILPAGAMVERLIGMGRQLVADDSGRLAVHAWRGALGSPGGVVEAMRQSRGGRNLASIGLGADVDYCATLNTLGVVPVFDPASGRITRR